MNRIAIAWIILLSAGLLEIVWAFALKYSEGFTRWLPSILGISTAIISFILLTIALKSLPIGTAYAVWVGIGALGVAIFGIIVLGESTEPLRIISLLLIVMGVIGLKIF